MPDADKELQSAGADDRPSFENERKLLSRIARGDTEALGGIYKMYSERIFHFTYRMLNNRNDAEDATAETFLKVLRYSGELRANGAFRTWLFRIARNACIDKLRQHKLLELPEDVVYSSGEEKESLRIAVQQALSGLPTEYREPLVLCDLEDMAAREAAEVLKISVPALKSRLYRGRRALKDKLSSIMHVSADGEYALRQQPLPVFIPRAPRVPKATAVPDEVAAEPAEQAEEEPLGDSTDSLDIDPALVDFIETFGPFLPSEEAGDEIKTDLVPEGPTEETQEEDTMSETFRARIQERQAQIAHLLWHRMPEERGARLNTTTLAEELGIDRGYLSATVHALANAEVLERMSHGVYVRKHPLVCYRNGRAGDMIDLDLRTPPPEIEKAMPVVESVPTLEEGLMLEIGLLLALQDEATAEIVRLEALRDEARARVEALTKARSVLMAPPLLIQQVL